MITIEEAIRSNDIVVGLSLIFAALVGLIAYAYCNACRRSVKAAAARAINKAIREEREKCDMRIHAEGVARFAAKCDADMLIEKQNGVINSLKRENERLRKLIEVTEGRSQNGR